MPELDDAGDISGRFEIVVDENAEPADIGEALAEFLLGYVRTETGDNPQANPEGQD